MSTKTQRPTWKQRFGNILNEHLKQHYGRSYSSEREIFEAILAIEDRIGLWNKIAASTDLIGRELHDYWHNSFIKKFMDDHRPFKAEIYAACEQQVTDRVGSQAAMINNVVVNFQRAHPTLNFHTISLRQMIRARILNLMEAMEAKAQNNSTSTDTQATQDGISEEDLLLIKQIFQMSCLKGRE